MPFDIEKLKGIGFSDTDCEAVVTLEAALRLGHYPKGTYKPASKPYMVDFRRVVKLYFEFLTERLSDEPGERCLSVKSITEGLRGLSDLLLGKNELPGCQLEVSV